ncbi:MAG: rhodanese-like domain-containing protein [Chlorobi bacterium]|nr:rhodanese-like domain-containing protein [Chlorobiota bacterium]
MRAFRYFLILLVTAFTAQGCSGDGKIKNITVQELKTRLDAADSLVVLDVRTPAELEGELGRLSGIINIPVQVLEQRWKELEKYKDKEIYIICRSGNRSRTAAGILAKHGFNVYNVKGGMRAWRKAFGNANK